MTVPRPEPIRVGIVGVGNCASSFVQGLHHYRGVATDGAVPGLISPELGGYRIDDIAIASAFDVSAEKVGQDVARAIHARPNNTHVFAEVPSSGVTVQRGPTLDGIGRYLQGIIEESPAPVADVVAELKRSRTQVLVNYLPVGAQRATEFYARCALDAGCALVNCIPVFIASDDAWRARFEARGLPVVGDDIKSQVGATIVHRVLANLLRERGVKLERTYQLNFGGNADFLNMLERERLESKKLSKTRAVTSQLDAPLEPGNVHVGPSDHVPWLEDRKWAQIRLEGTGFGGVPLNMELKLEVWDSPNSAGIVVDAVRCARIALDRGLGGALGGPSAWFMKSPPVQYTDAEARARTLRFAAGEPA
ncbi:inositol-3-phosphate synthase [Methylorubrum rhodesianum]|uniref:inositol-3-phosphate synthase n=1 Tax=Methylorubrum TaxID=2282523 RepID=UPI001612A6B0|nr:MULTISPECIES: inositol-3-phosphate synthase [Methylorubrum]MBB5763488.1 myo-inositol-1-phosphate synthase [Methylorubrum rhodesianum]MBI1690785.1 inositol-3-phosphate synthase [Methylorubrum sp. DB1722]